MGVFTFGEALAAAGLGQRRSSRPVRRGSQRKGACEGGFWRAFDPRQSGRMMRAAELYDRAGKRPGSRNGALGHVALEVLRALLRRIDYRTGRLDPALTTLMADTARSRGAVVRALASLRDHGFLGWIRRFVEVAAEGAGPRVRQASNAYRLMLPEAALRLLGARAGPPPLPADAAHALAEAAGAMGAMEARMSIAGAGGRLVGGPLGEALDRLAESLLRRESIERSESGQRIS